MPLGPCSEASLALIRCPPKPSSCSTAAFILLASTLRSTCCASARSSLTTDRPSPTTKTLVRPKMTATQHMMRHPRRSTPESSCQHLNGDPYEHNNRHRNEHRDF